MDQVSSRPLKCPICGNIAADAYRPFCSKRCADIDLAKWFAGSYAIVGREDDESPPVQGPGSDDEPKE